MGNFGGVKIIQGVKVSYITKMLIPVEVLIKDTLQAKDCRASISSRVILVF